MTITVHQIDPIALQVGQFSIHWYGLMYLISFIAALFLLRFYRNKLNIFKNWSNEAIENLLSYGMFGVILGGRLGYVIFYKFTYYVEHPLEIFQLWQGGMSFHGGLVGVIVAMFLFAKKYDKSFLQIADFLALVTPVGLLFGRIGNFINGELWGRTTDVPWAMIFPYAQDNLARHPSQLYEAFFEGLLLGLILMISAFIINKRAIKAYGFLSGLFVFGYALARFSIEFYREPDYFLGLRALGLTTGQWLCIPMLIVGIYLIILWFKQVKQEKQEKLST